MPTSELLGRDAEIATLLAGVDAARDRRPSTILVGGDAGMGKTRLLTELVARSEDRILWGGCLPMGERGVPYLPLIEMFRSLQDAERESLPQALEGLVPRGRAETSGRAASRAQLFQSVLDVFEDLASHSALIIVVEDIHWADRSTRDFLDFLIGLLRNQRILVVASFRTDDLPSPHPLRTQLAEWLRRPSVTRLDLRPLPPEEGLRLIAPLISDSGASRDQAMRLVERAEGNPFFLEELAAAGPLAGGTPGPMRDLLLRRTRDLPPSLLRLLRVASAGGTNIDEDLLSRVAGLPEGETRALLRDGIDALLLVIDEHGCRFRHALLAEALHEDLLPAERREYHAGYADALTSRSGPVRPGELATHQAEAGRIDAALGSCVVAGEAAEALFAFAEAEHSYEAALSLWEQAENPEVATGLTHIELLRRLAEAAFLAGDARIACQVARAALEEIYEEFDPITAGLVHHRLARYLRNTEESDAALATQERAVALIPASPPSPERAQVLSGLALTFQFENRYREAQDLATEAIEVAVETGEVNAEIQARNTLGNAVCTLEDVDRGLSIIEGALELGRRAGDAHEQARSIWNLQANRYLGARLTDYVDHAEETIASLRITQPHWVLDHMVDAADALHLLGRWQEADAMIEAARNQDPTIDHVGLPELLIARHQFDEARALVAASTQSPIMVDIEIQVREYVFLADIAAWEGDPAEAVRLIEKALERFKDQEKPSVIRVGFAIGLRAAADMAARSRLKGDTLGVELAVEAGEGFRRRMTEVMEQPGPPDGWKREARCLVLQCDAESSRLHGQSDPNAWMAAIEGWLELSMPYRAAYCRFRWVESMLATGADRGEVISEVRDLFAFFADLGARVLSDEVKALARRARIDLGDRYPVDPYGLTDREREVLTRVARGLTNRHIAGELFISEKTASVHVSNILRKLTATNRGEAAAKAVREGLVEVGELRSGS